ncbi:MAG: Holliday junction branch migration protein RuvA [Cyanobacteriota bacterium]|jgi:Holliday junction DNA helicase RuvA
MIGWLQGELVDPWEQATRWGLLLNCHGVGYEVQVSQRHWARLPEAGQRLTLHVHHIIRDDAWNLFGFESRQERDLFRELVAVNGVGPQMGLALLGTMGAEALVKAIIEGDGRLLTQAPGVGKRTAERLCLELRQKLLERFASLASGLAVAAHGDGEGAPGSGEAAPHGDEVQRTLSAMGYDRLEILAALRAVAAKGLDPTADPEQWLGDCLRWLSRAAA